MKIGFRKRLVIASVAIIAFGLSLTSCDPEEIIEQIKPDAKKTKLYTYVSDLMHDVYYWYKEVPANIFSRIAIACKTD